jgi:glutamate racemase
MRGERRPIGVFDSGVGGLTVLAALRRALPHDDFIYLGDTARLPYGTKSGATVQRYSLQCAAALRRRGIGCLVVACNTAAASSLDALRAAHPDLPVIGVIEPGATAAVAASATQRIAVIGTESTIGGGAYQRAIARLSVGAVVTARACSLLVALAEEGWTEGPIVDAIVRRYLTPLFAGDDAPDTLVLGCTHFPLLTAALGAGLPPTVRLVDSAATTARAVADRLGVHSPAVANEASTEGPVTEAFTGRITWLVTDDVARFARVGSRFFGASLREAAVEVIDL